MRKTRGHVRPSAPALAAWACWIGLVGCDPAETTETLATASLFAGDAGAAEAFLVAGTFDTTLALGGARVRAELQPIDGEPATETRRVFVARLDRHGRADWLQALQAPGHETVLYGSDVDSDGIVVLASYRGPAPVRTALGIPPAASGMTGLLLCRIDMAGTVLWCLKLGAWERLRGASLARRSRGLAVEASFETRSDVTDRTGAAPYGRRRGAWEVDPTGRTLTVGTAEPELAVCAHSICQTGVALAEACDTYNICGTKDPYCCDVAWDALCVTESDERGIVSCPCTHAFQSSGLRLVRQCSKLSCAEQVCDGIGDTYCCSSFWDGICSGETVGVCP